MKVKATRLGYWNHKRRKKGEVFELTDVYEENEEGEKKLVAKVETQFSPKWMKKVETKRYVEVDEDVEEPGEKGKKAKSKIKTEDELPKQPTGNQDVI